MKILIVEDDATSRLLLRKQLEAFGACDVAINGKEAVALARKAIDDGNPYTLICLDIMMPEMDGQAALRQIREHEVEMGCLPSRASKIIMTTALRDIENVTQAYRDSCDGYLVKPLQRDNLIALLKELNLITVRDDRMVPIT